VLDDRVLPVLILAFDSGVEEVVREVVGAGRGACELESVSDGDLDSTE